MSDKTAYLALGSNLGDRTSHLYKAMRLIDASVGCSVTAVSSLYLTAPVGYTDQPEFVNAVIEIATELNPQDLLALCSSIEQALGRERTIRWGPRVIDIDILLYSSVYIDDDNLTVPHPRMMERAFVLVPLAEIAPDVELPGGITASEAAERVDKSGVQIMQDRTWSL